MSEFLIKNINIPKYQRMLIIMIAKMEYVDTEINERKKIHVIRYKLYSINFRYDLSRMQGIYFS